MKKYDDFLLERMWNGTRKINESQFWKLFDENCEYSDILISKDFGEERFSDFIFYEKLKKERKSIGGKNYYTLLMNNLESWKEYPKREQICSLNGYWSNSSGDNSYIAIPFKNSKWGVLSGEDMWWTKWNIYNTFILELTDLKEIMIFNEKYINDINWTKMKNDIVKNNDKIAEKLYKISNGKIKIDNVLKFFEDEFTPENLNIKLIDYNDLKNFNEILEIWTDQPCLYVKKELFLQEILPKIKERNIKMDNEPWRINK